MNKLTFLAVFFFVLASHSQDSYSKQFSIITDNDLYTSINRDKYYTSGIFLSYKYASKKIKNTEIKRIYTYKIGHEMYTPQKSIVRTIQEHDRPFAAYLYGEYGITRVFDDQIFSTDYQLGTIGPGALGKEIQDFIHDIYGFRRADGWKYQIQSAIGVNARLTYAKTIYRPPSNLFDITWLNQGSIGTVYTNVATGFYTRIGFKTLQPISNTMAFDTHLNRSSEKRGIESFLFINPMFRLAMYDATLQGSFLNSSSEVTKELIPLVFHLQAGLLFTANRFNFGYIYHFSTSKSKGLVFDNGNIYGTIAINYLFR